MSPHCKILALKNTDTSWQKSLVDSCFYPKKWAEGFPTAAASQAKFMFKKKKNSCLVLVDYKHEFHLGKLSLCFYGDVLEFMEKNNYFSTSCRKHLHLCVCECERNKSFQSTLIFGYRIPRFKIIPVLQLCVAGGVWLQGFFSKNIQNWSL